MPKIKINPFLIISFVVVLIYLLLINWLFEAWSYFLNPDGYSYLTIALKFQSLQPKEMMLGVNGLWSPLFPLFCTLFLTDSGQIVALKLANAVTGILGVIIFIKLMKRFEINPLYAGILAFSVITTSLALSLTIVSPDQLVVCFLLFYTYLLLKSSYPLNAKYAFYCGIIGFIAYLTKQYAFYFFVLHFTIINAIYLYYYWITDYKKRIIKNYIVGFITFLILSSIWIGLVSYRYKNFTLENSTKINVFLLLKSKQNDSLLTDYGLLPPSNHSAINAWEDPTLLLSKSNGDPISVKQVLGKITENIIKIYFKDSGYIFSLLVVIIFAWYIRKSRIEPTLKLRYFILVVSYLVFPLGYIILRVEFRYLLYMYYLSLTMLGILLSTEYFLKLSTKIKLLIIIICILSIFKPLTSIPGRYFNKDMYLTIENLSNVDGYFLPNDLYASNGNYFGTTALAYQLKGKYYGQIMSKENNESIENDLSNYKIKYYVVWQDEGPQYVPQGYPITVTYAKSDKVMFILVKRY